MTFKFECPACQQRIAAEPADAGIISVCPTCDNQFVVPQPPPRSRVIVESAPTPMLVQTAAVTKASSSGTKACPMCGEQILLEAKKCKHCGEYLEPTTRVAATPQSEPSDTLGIVIMLFPVASTVLAWFWIGSMTLFQNPTSTLAGIVIVTVITTSAFMAIEAGQLGMGGERNGAATTGPAGWFMCGLLLWIVAMPAYLYTRSKYGLKNYLVGGLLSAIAFLSIAGLLEFAIEQKKSMIRHHLMEP